jgi:hypothetical protein
MNIGYFFAVLRASFYSKAFYRAVGQQWKGYAVGYLAGAVALSWAVVITVWLAKISAIDVRPEADGATNDVVVSDTDSDTSRPVNISTLLQGIIAQVPVITVEKGEASIEEDEPYIINIPGTDTPFAIIDTTGKTTTLKGTAATVLLTKDELLIVSSSETDTKYKIAELLENDTIVIDRVVLTEWVGTLKKFMLWFVPLVIFPFMVILSLAYTLLRALFYAAIGMVFARIQAIKLPFQTIMRLAVITSIPVTLLSTLPIIFPVLLLMPYQRLIFFVVAMGYLFYAIHLNQDAMEEQE